MFRKTIFWLHLACGVSAGVVVLMMSVTGVVLTYERQAQVWEDRSYSDRRAPMVFVGEMGAGLGAGSLLFRALPKK
jgi:uncharacterized iron-regulated membrane protein